MSDIIICNETIRLISFDKGICTIIPEHNNIHYGMGDTLQDAVNDFINANFMPTKSD